MKSRLKNGIEVKRGSGNVYADLGLADAEKLKIKTGLVIEIRKAMRSLGLTQQEAAKRMSISQPKVSDMMRGDFTNLSERKLMDCLTRLGYDIEISVRPAKSAPRHGPGAAVVSHARSARPRTGGHAGAGGRPSRTQRRSLAGC